MALLELQDPEGVRPLLHTRSLHNLRLLGLLFPRAAEVEGVWTDTGTKPTGVLVRAMGAYCLYAIDETSTYRLLRGIPWSSEVTFAGIFRLFVDAIMKETLVISHWPADLYAFIGGVIPHQSPQGLRPLGPEDAPLVNAHWGYRDDVDYVRRRIQSGPAWGLTVEGALVSWALTHADGAIGCLHTLESHRAKGYARRVVAAVASDLLAMDRVPYAFIERGNYPSERVLGGLGFSRIGEYAWMRVERVAGIGRLG